MSWSKSNFIYFCLSFILASIGGFFTLVALPWLVLSIDNNPLTLSSVIVCMSLPQGFFILFGGVLSDVYSPYRVLIISRILFCLTLFALFALVSSGLMVLWHLYVFAFFIGTFSSISLSSSQSLLPSLIPEKKLNIGNGIYMGTTQLAQVVGPILAAWVIYTFRSYYQVAESDVHLFSIALAFLVDAFALAISLLLVLRIKLKANVKSDKVNNFILFFVDGLKFCFRDKAILLILGYLLAASFFIHGPLAVSMPLLAKQKFMTEITGYGNLYSALGGGLLVGTVTAMLVKIPSKSLGFVLVVCDLISGGILLSLARAGELHIAMGHIAAIGFCLGLISVAGTTWFQQRTPAMYMGRTMSILLFCIIGFTPVSASIFGFAIVETSIETALITSGVLLMIVAGVGLSFPKLRKIGALPRLT